MPAEVKAWLIDVVERAAFAFVETFIALLLATELSSAKTAAVAGLSSALAVLKGALATLRKNTLSPASVAK